MDKVLVIILIMISHSCFSNEKSLNFESYLVESPRLEQSGSLVNFAGEYIAYWESVGTGAQVWHIEHAVTKKKLDAKILSSNGACFRKDSRLFITDPGMDGWGELGPPNWYFTRYYLITDDSLELIREDKVGYQGECESGQ